MIFQLDDQQIFKYRRVNKFEKTAGSLVAADLTPAKLFVFWEDAETFD